MRCVYICCITGALGLKTMNKGIRISGGNLYFTVYGGNAWTVSMFLFQLRLLLGDFTSLNSWHGVWEPTVYTQPTLAGNIQVSLFVCSAPATKLHLYCALTAPCSYTDTQHTLQGNKLDTLPPPAGRHQNNITSRTWEESLSFRMAM